MRPSGADCARYPEELPDGTYSLAVGTGEALSRLVSTVDLTGLHEWFARADQSLLEEARVWYRGGRTWTRTLYAYDGEISTAIGHERHHELHWIRGTLAVGLSGPTTAARDVPWRSFWDHHDDARGRLALT